MLAQPQQVTVPKRPADPVTLWLGFAAELAPRTDVWQRMLGKHIPTPEGFCAAPECGRPGRGVPHVRWPCSSWAIAEAARLLHR